MTIQRNDIKSSQGHLIQQGSQRSLKIDIIPRPQGGPSRVGNDQHRSIRIGLGMRLRPQTDRAKQRQLTAWPRISFVSSLRRLCRPPPLHPPTTRQSSVTPVIYLDLHPRPSNPLSNRLRCYAGSHAETRSSPYSVRWVSPCRSIEPNYSSTRTPKTFLTGPPTNISPNIPRPTALRGSPPGRGRILLLGGERPQLADLLIAPSRARGQPRHRDPPFSLPSCRKPCGRLNSKRPLAGANVSPLSIAVAARPTDIRFYKTPREVRKDGFCGDGCLSSCARAHHPRSR
jgi:hypothetical protein